MKDLNLSYRITDKILTNIAKIERTIAVLQQNEVSSKSSYRVTMESEFEDIYALSTLLGVGATLGEVKQIAFGKGQLTKDNQILHNLRQIFDFLRNNYSKSNLTFNFYFVQHIIKLLQTNLLDIWEIGKIRTGEELSSPLYELDNQRYINSEVNNLLADSIIWIEEDQEVHPIVKAVVFLMFFNSLSPLTGLNFVSSVVLFRLILFKYGYTADFNIPLYKIFVAEKGRIKSKIEETLAYNQGGITEVIECITEEIEKILLEYKNRLIEFDYYNVKNDLNQLDLNERQTKLLKLLQTKLTIRRKEYIKLFKVASMTGYRDLNYLVEKKLLVAKGLGKSTYYTLITKA